MNAEETRSKADLEKKLSRNRTLEERVTDLTSQLIYYQDLLNNLTKDTEHYKLKFHSFQKQVEDLKALLQEKEEKQLFLIDQLDISKTKIEEAREEDVKQITELKEINNELSDENRKVGSLLQALEKEKEISTEEIEKLQGIIDALKSENSLLAQREQNVQNERKNVVKNLKKFWLFLSEKESRAEINVSYKIYLRIFECFEQDPDATVTSLSLAKDLKYTPDVIYSELKEMVEREVITFSDTSNNDFYDHEIRIS